VECAALPAGSAGVAEPVGVLAARGGALPFVRLRSLLGPGRDAPAREDVVVVRHGADTLALLVDALEGAQRTVVKPLGPLFRGAAGVSGAALLGDGGVALILDIASLLRAALPRASASPDPRSQP
jgi:two-component system chemotaxis sensor kinase CheA